MRNEQSWSEGFPESFVADSLKLLQELGADQAAVLVPCDGYFVTAGVAQGENEAPSVSQTLLRKAVAQPGPLLVTDVANDMSSVQSSTLIRLKSALILKIRGPEGRIAAILYGDSRFGDRVFENTEMHKAVEHVESIERQLKASELRRNLKESSEKKSRAGRLKSAAKAKLQKVGKGTLGRPRGNALSVFFRSLGCMLEAGITTFRGMEVLSEHTEDPVVKETCRRMSLHLREGVQLSEAMQKFPSVFQSLHVNLIKLGEETGDVGQTALSISDIEGRRDALNRKVRGALTYPALVFMLCLIGAIFGPPFLLEGHFEIIRNSGAEPPMLTKLVMAFSDFASSPWAYVALALTFALCWGQWRVLRRSPERMYDITLLQLSLPILGAFLKKVALTRFAQAFSLALEVGVRVDKAMLLAGAASGNCVLAADMSKCRKQLLESGSGVSESLAASEFFTRLFLQMVAVGEDTADLPRLMAWVSELYEDETEAAVETMTALLEPLVMAIVGVIVAILVLAAMLPLVQMFDTL